MSKKCPKGQIYREAYTRHSSKGKLIDVAGNCIRATSQSGLKRSPIDRAIINRKKIESERFAREHGHLRCPAGTIERTGFINKNGVKVSPTCIKDVGRKGKGEQLFVLETGVLRKYGYHDVASLSAFARQKALKAALRDGIKPLSLLRKINALYVLNMYKNKNLASIFASDRDWIRGTHEYQTRQM